MAIPRRDGVQGGQQGGWQEGQQGEVDEYEAYAVNKVDKEVNKVVDEYEANAVDQELNDGLELEDVVMVMVVEVMKLTLVMEMVVDKEVYVEVDEVAKDVSISYWKQLKD